MHFIKSTLFAVSLMALFFLPTNAYAEDWADTLAIASYVTDTSAEELAAIAFVESSFKANAKNPHSSAVGYFQLTKPTWRHLVKTYGEEYSIKYKHRKDPRANAVMGALYIREVREIMSGKLHRDITTLEVYLGHKFGPERAARLLKKPTKTALVDFYPGAASRNKSVYYTKSGEKRTIAGLKSLFSKRLSRAVKTYGARAMAATVSYLEFEFLPFKLALQRAEVDCVKKEKKPDPISRFKELLKSPLERIQFASAIALTNQTPTPPTDYSHYDAPAYSGRKFNGTIV